MSFSNIYRRAKRLFGVDVPGGMEWFEDAGDPAELIAIDRVINNNVFSTKEGGYFAVFACAGIDDECLSNEQLQAVSASVRGAQQRLDGIVAYHVAVKKRSTRRIHKHANSANPVVAQAQQEREDHLASQGLCQIELFIALYVPPTLNWQTWWPESHAKAIKSQLKKLDDAIRIFPIMLGNFGLRLLSTVEASDVYGYIANLTDDYAGLEPRGDVSKILARSRIGWNDDGLRIGQQFARVFSLLIEPQWTRPNMFGDLLKIDADMVLVFECSRRSADETRAAADSQEAFLNVFREKLRTVLAYIGDRNADMYLNMGPRSATSQATDKSVKKVSDVLDDLQNGFGYTESSLIGLIHGSNSAVLDEKMAEIHTFANKSQMVIHREGIAALCGYATLFPGAKMGGVSTNVRRRWLRDDHAANMSLMYAPC